MAVRQHHKEKVIDYLVKWDASPEECQEVWEWVWQG